MQTNTFAILAISGAAIAAVYATEPCNMSAIKGSLLPNGTTWHESCTAKTGVDVFAMSMFPTKAQAKNISQSRDCVNYINQINQQANTAIQCEITVGDQTIILGELLTDLLKGQTGNKTKETVVGSSSMSGSVSLSSSASASGNASTAGSESAFSSKKKKTISSGSTASSSSTAADKQESSSTSGKNATSSASVAALSVVAAAATTVLAFAL
ncbi:Elicitin-like protein [Phytophthora cinnamomi]|uniref:Elicitin-like protein n=1 Tax=Phytophthora cinnamomi TaxID=4785 RepID=UPI002A2C8821|nr:Elicitin-like protein [Phytophthora cinnamomi]KAJ8556877.1 hypothetical protein ON010_g9088 [Phytophthora cinnamomi]